MVDERAFGVEIEFTLTEDGYSRDFAYELLEKNKIWQNTSIGYDGSDIEVKSPILRGTPGFRELRKVLRLFSKNGGRVTSCDGLHVHHDAPEFIDDPPLTKRLVESWYLNQRLIDRFVNRLRRDRYGCCPNYTSTQIHRMKGGSYESYINLTDETHPKYMFGRHSLNVSSLNEHGTIEIRKLQGTLDDKLAEAWIKFGQSFIRTVLESDEILPPNTNPSEFLSIIGVHKPVKDKLLSVYEVQMFTNLDPPDGWEFTKSAEKDFFIVINNKSAEYSFSTEEYKNKFKALFLWADKHKETLSVSPFRNTRLSYIFLNDSDTWFTFCDQYKVSYKEATVENELKYETNLCPICDIESYPWEANCPCGYLKCRNCSNLGINLSHAEELYNSNIGIVRLYCDNCSLKCETDNCYKRIGYMTPSSRVQAALNIRHCSECRDRIICIGCRCQVYAEETVSIHNVNYCVFCSLTICVVCGTMDRSNTRTGNNGYMCRHCFRSPEVLLTNEKNLPVFEWKTEDIPVIGSMLIPSSDARPTRTISIETEFDGHRNKVAAFMKHHDLIGGTQTQSYSSRSSDYDGRFPCFIKSDSSVSGGEVITYLLDLSNENHVASLEHVLSVLKSCEQEGWLSLSSRAGGHIHMDLHGFTEKDAHNLYKLFHSAQATIYYLAGAGSPFGHRSLEGSNYGAALRSAKTIREFRAYATSGRNALNFVNFMDRQHNCHCEWGPDSKDCTCGKGMLTAEWRIWNAQINPRILHGWILLMQAMTAYAESYTMKKSLPMPDYSGDWRMHRRWSLATMSQRELIFNTLEWFHEFLPLSMEERDSLNYVIRMSDIGKGNPKAVDKLLNIENVSALSGIKLKVGAGTPLREQIQIFKPELIISDENESTYFDTLEGQAVLNRRNELVTQLQIDPNYLVDPFYLEDEEYIGEPYEYYEEEEPY